MNIRQITAAIILCATIGGYLFLGVWILANMIFSWIGGRGANSSPRETKAPVGLARDPHRWANTWMPRNIT
jgi:hypothetical protein